MSAGHTTYTNCKCCWISGRSKGKSQSSHAHGYKSVGQHLRQKPWGGILRPGGDDRSLGCVHQCLCSHCWLSPAPCSLCLCSACSLSAAQLWVSMVTGQLIRAMLFLSGAAARTSTWLVHTHPDLWAGAGNPRAHTHAQSDARRHVQIHTGHKAIPSWPFK